jgi:hypothetical protein
MASISSSLLPASSSLTTPVNSSVGFAAANTEYSFNFPTNTKEFMIINESSAVIKISWASGDTGTNYFKMIPGQVYNSPSKAITASNITLYWQSNKAVTSAEGLKVVSWS